MTVKQITDTLEDLAPLHYAEEFDNVGLLVGDANQEVTGVLVTLDTLEVVIDEAIAKKCNLVVSFHPIIFSGLKKLTGTTYVERVVLKAIAHNIAIYSMHTALDNSKMGVNAKICEVLGIQQPKILIPKTGTIKKLTTYVPLAHAETLRNELFKAGAGHIGNYSHCSFSVEGSGSFLPKEGSNPTVGVVGNLHLEKEVQLQLTFESRHQKNILTALVHHHPYEEVAYEVITLENQNQNLGMGMVGSIVEEKTEEDVLAFIKKRMKAGIIRHSELLQQPVKKIAVLGGSGSFAIGAAIASGADVFITADLKYHQFYQAEGRIVLVDIGHFETEQFTKNLLVDFLKKKIPNFAVTLSESITNPIKYF